MQNNNRKILRFENAVMFFAQLGRAAPSPNELGKYLATNSEDEIILLFVRKTNIHKILLAAECMGAFDKLHRRKIKMIILQQIFYLNSVFAISALL